MPLLVGSRSDSSRKLMFLLLAVLVPPAVALVWLGLRLLEQDRTLLRQREAERREAAAERVVRGLVLALTETERALADGSVPEGTVRVRIAGDRVEVDPAAGVAWIPVAPPLRDYATQPFEDAERDEFQDRGDRGRARYAALSTARDPAERAGALVRLARLARREGRTGAAIAAYRALSRLEDIGINGTAADLVARRMICDLLHSAGREVELAAEATALASDLARGRWLLDRTSWELAASELRAWSHPATISAERTAMSAALEAFQASGARQPEGRRVLIAGGLPVTVSWRGDASETRIVLVPPARVAAWIELVSRSESPGVASITVLTEGGEVVARTPVDEQRGAVTPGVTERGAEPQSGSVLRTAGATGLPWALRVSTGDAGAATADFQIRQRLLSGGLAALVVLLCGGSYLLWRVVRREIAVARLQTDFVATVSHEFRTPLTSLRHVTELLQESDDLPPERRQSFYAVLAQSGERLQRLVESLLDFARMEAGEQSWQLRPLDPLELVNAAAAEFHAAHPHRVLELRGAAPPGQQVMADRDAMMQALSNLLDNAVKYSPGGGSIELRLQHRPGALAFVVSDAGLGIPASEQRQVLGRFVRGRAARELGIKGTGLGLALVAHIVDAHGGRIEVASEERRGSAFTIVLPACALPDPNSGTSLESSAVHATNSHR